MVCSPGPEILSFPGSDLLREVSSLVHLMFHLIFMNIGHLISIHKQKIICNDNSLFLCFSETFSSREHC